MKAFDLFEQNQREMALLICGGSACLEQNMALMSTDILAQKVLRVRDGGWFLKNRFCKGQNPCLI